MGISCLTVVLSKVNYLGVWPINVRRLLPTIGPGIRLGARVWQEMRQKRGQDCWYEKNGEWPGLREGPLQLYQSVSDVPEQEHYDRKDQELERLHKQARDLELEVRGRRRRRNHAKSPEDISSTRGSRGESSHHSGSRQSRERLCEYAKVVVEFA